MCRLLGGTGDGERGTGAQHPFPVPRSPFTAIPLPSKALLTPDLRRWPLWHLAPWHFGTLGLMYIALLVILILDALLLCAVVLLQAGQGGGLASLGGATTDNVIGGRQATTLLTKASWWCGGIFLGLSLLLSVMHRSGTAPESDLQRRLRETTPPSAPAPLPIQGTPTPAPGATGTTGATGTAAPSTGAPAAP